MRERTDDDSIRLVLLQHGGQQGAGEVDVVAGHGLVGYPRRATVGHEGLARQLGPPSRLARFVAAAAVAGMPASGDAGAEDEDVLGRWRGREEDLQLRQEQVPSRASLLHRYVPPGGLPATPK